MEKPRKERYEFKYPGYDEISACNIYLFRADSVFYFGFEDIGVGVSITDAIKEISEYVVKRYSPKPENAFFFRWYSRYKSRGVEQIEFEWNKKKLGKGIIKKFCEYKENPFI